MILHSGTAVSAFEGEKLIPGAHLPNCRERDLAGNQKVKKSGLTPGPIHPGRLT